MSTDGRDYHTEMNSNLFEKWIKDQLLWARILPGHKAFYITPY
jgi:hypothetical protein